MPTTLQTTVDHPFRLLWVFLVSSLGACACGSAGGKSTTPAPQDAAPDTRADRAGDAGSDLVPPVISGGSPSGALVPGTTAATLTVTTDENATCKWGTADATYAMLPTTFATTGARSHASPLMGLANGAAYTYFVRCLDGAGNANTVSAQVTFSIGALASTILWHDDLQGNGGRDWGFDGLEIERNDVVISGSDSAGANLTRVPDPLSGVGFALRHFATFDEAGSRAQAGIWGFQNTIFGNQATSAQGVWVAQEWYFPSAITAGGDVIPWINLWDWHSTDGVGGGNRWHTSPGLMLAEDGSMRVKWEWGGDAEMINLETGLSSVALPVGRWFDIEMHYRWATSGVTLSLWIDGVLALEQRGVQTRRASHTVVETYSKFYGSQNGGDPWSPTPSIRYTRNVRVANGRIWR